MIDIYLRKPEVVRAVRLDPTAESIDECVAFVTGVKTRNVSVDSKHGIRIEMFGLILNVEYGEYIVNYFDGEFRVLSADVFDALYNKAGVVGGVHLLPYDKESEEF